MTRAAIQGAAGHVTMVAVKGAALFEIRRLFSQWVTLETQSPGKLPQAVAVLCGDLSVLPRTRRDEREVPVLHVGIGHGMVLAPYTMHHVEHYNLADPFAKLVLLARIAALSARHADLRVHTLSSRQCDVYEGRPLYQCVAIIQRTFNLHLTERELLDRVEMSASSLYRLFRQTGALPPSRLLQWVRMHEVAKRLALDEGIGKAAEQLGFEHAESARRTMRTLTRMPLSALRSDVGLIEFERRMASACRAESL